MQIATSDANTKTWLEATKKITISAPIESYMPTISMRQSSFIGVWLHIQSDLTLEMELQSWDILSDDALWNFEHRLR